MSIKFLTVATIYYYIDSGIIRNREEKKKEKIKPQFGLALKP